MKNNYSTIKLFQYFFWLLRTKLIIPKARLIRFPIDLRGKKYIDFGQRLTTGVGCRLEAFAVDGNYSKRIVFGSNVQINDYVHISSMNRVEIGNNVLMASHVYISDNSHGVYKGTIEDSSPNTPPPETELFN